MMHLVRGLVGKIVVDKHHGGKRHGIGAEILDLLLHLVRENPEVAFLEIADELPLFVFHRDGHNDGVRGNEDAARLILPRRRVTLRPGCLWPRSLCPGSLRWGWWR